MKRDPDSNSIRSKLEHPFYVPTWYIISSYLGMFRQTNLPKVRIERYENIEMSGALEEIACGARWSNNSISASKWYQVPINV